MTASPAIDRSATLVVTRPALDAGPLIDALRARGRSVVALPVIAIEPTGDTGALKETMARVADYRLVVFVSPNAIRLALAQRSQPWPVTTVIGVMGPGSVATLEGLGIASPRRRVVSPASAAPEGASTERFDSESLFAALDDALGLTKGFDGRVLILRGNGGRAWFADRVRALGIAVDEVAAYRRVRPAADPAAARALGDAAAAGTPVVFVVTSSEGVVNLMTIVDEALAPGSRAWLLACRLLVPHRRIAEKARESGFSEVSVCAPGDRGILAAIE